MHSSRAPAFPLRQPEARRPLIACAGAALTPLLAGLAFQAVTGRWDGALLAILVLATLAAGALALAALRRLAALPPAAVVAAPAVPSAGLPGARLPLADSGADRDALTGLHSRHGFLDLSERLLAEGGNSVIALVDIDHFQAINDRFGRTAGDALLRAVGHRLDRGLRRSDLAARWAGEAFAVLLPDTQLDEARLVMERLRASVALDPLLGPESTGNPWPVTFSCGLAPVRGFSHLGEATHRAHAALDAAKHGGRNRVRTAGTG